MRLSNSYFALGLALYCSFAHAAAWQSRESIQAAAESFVAQKTASIDGEVTISSTPPDARVKVANCDKLETSLQSGNRLWGRTNITVSCNSPAKWSLRVPVNIKVVGKALVATRAIGSGQTIEAQDVTVETLDLTPYPIGVFKTPEQAVGKVTANSIAAGSPFRAEVLRAQMVIKQGQQVVVVAQSAHIKVSTEGVAMNNAQAGQVVGVKTKSGAVVKGIAKSEGVVEVNF